MNIYKIKKICMLISILLIFDLLLVSCGGGSTNDSGDGDNTIEPVDPVDPNHTHTIQTVEAKDATCEHNGNIKYYYCEGCGKYFSDSSGSTEISSSDVEIPATIHNYEASYDWYNNVGKHCSIALTCTKCGHIFYDYCTVTSEVIKEPTSTSEGKIKYTATYTYKYNSITYTDTLNETLDKVYTITLDSNGGEVSTTSITTNIGKVVTLPTPTLAGYTFLGWYNGTTLYESGRWQLEEDITLTAKWEIATYNIKYIINGGENSEDNLTSVTYKDSFTLSNPVTTPTVYEKNGKYYTCTATFSGWYSDENYENKISKVSNVTSDLTIYAKLEYSDAVECSASYFLENGGSYLRVDESGNVSSTGDYILYGTYPQTLVTDDTLNTNLKTYLAELLSVSKLSTTTSLPSGFTSYNYYLETSIYKNLMGYMDIEYENEKYRCVYATQYRTYDPSKTGSSEYKSYMDDNGYIRKNYYFFKYEPIKWKIIYENDGKVTLLSTLILDSQEWNYTDSSQTVDGETIYACNYEYSSIRTWLNDTFYNWAFNSYQKEILDLVVVDNSYSSTYVYNSVGNFYAKDYSCDDTKDNVWLLSYQEAFTTYLAEETSRLKSGTDYAKCQGLYVNDEGYSTWWLRSPYNSASNVASAIKNDDTFSGPKVYCRWIGVVPAVTITL